MNKEFKKKIYILGGLCLFFLALIVLLGGIQERQIMRQKAVGGPVNLSLSPTSGNIDQNGTTISVIMTNTGAAKNVRGAEVVLTLDANAVSRFEVSSAACSSTFPIPAPDHGASGNRVSLSCSVSGGSNVISLGSATLGTFVLKAKSGATAGNGNISFTSANIPESLVYTNLYGSGITGTFTVPGTTTPTPTPEPCTHNAWDNNRCRRCNVQRGDGWAWNLDCSDNGSWGNSDPSKNDPGASFATACACLRRCNRTVPPACPTLPPAPTATGVPVTPTPEACPTHNAWDKDKCRRCNVPRGTGWVWSPECSDNGSWGNSDPSKNDPGASFATACACLRHCNRTVPPACPTLPLAPTATPTTGACPRGELGNLDCSAAGEIGVQDLDIMVRCWGTACPTLSACQTKAAVCRRLPNIVILPSTTATRVDVYDLDKLIRCWGTTCR